MLAIYTGRDVALEVNLRKHISHMPPQSLNKAEPTLALKPRGHHRKSETGVSVAPKMDICPTKFLKKNPQEKSQHHSELLTNMFEYAPINSLQISVFLEQLKI